MSEIHAYFAGLIDGEGCFSLVKREGNRTKFRAAVEVKMTDRAVIEDLLATYGGQFAFKKRQKPHWKDQWRWRVRDGRAHETILAIYPFLRTKRADADRILAHFSTLPVGEKAG